DSGRRQALRDAEVADLGPIGSLAVGAADVARVAAINGLACGVHRAADLRRADVAVAEQFADGGRTHGALDAAANTQTIDNGPVDVRLIGRNPADGAVVGVAIAQVQVQRLDERLIGQDRDQGLDEDFGRVGRAGQGLNRVEAGDFHAADLAAVRQAVRAQVVDGRIALRQAGVRTEGEGVFAILSAQGDADFAGRQLEQTALHGRLDDALLAEGRVLAVAVDVVDAALRQLRQAERVEAAFAQIGAAGRIIQQTLNGGTRDVARLDRKSTRLN